MNLLKRRNPPEGQEVLTIIIPALNEAMQLRRLLPDLRLACPEAEVVLTDGGSWDETHEVVRHFPRVRLVTSERGRAKQMNAGARLAKGKVLLFLHADTHLPAGAQAAILEACRDPAAGGCRFDVRFDSPRPIFRLIAALMNLRSRLRGICTGDQAIFVKREVFEALAGYADIPLMEDVEFTRRLKRSGRLACLRLPVTTSARKWRQKECSGRSSSCGPSVSSTSWASGPTDCIAGTIAPALPPNEEGPHGRRFALRPRAGRSEWCKALTRP